MKLNLFINNEIYFIHNVLKKTPFLSKKEQFHLQKGLDSGFVRNLNEMEQQKLRKILPSLFWAEKQLRTQGKKITRYLELFINYLRVESLVSRTLGPWNFHKLYAARFNYSSKEFVQVLRDFDLSTMIVIRHICEDIGLKKTPEMIFAEYNGGTLCTKLAGFQYFWNNSTFRNFNQEPLEEDGLWGKATVEALLTICPEKKDFLLQEAPKNEEINKILSYVSQITGEQIPARIPQRKKKSGNIKWSFNLDHLLRFFRRDTDIALYVNWGMEAYNEYERL